MAEMYIIIYLNGDSNDVPRWCIHTIDDDGHELLFEALDSFGHDFRYRSRAVNMETSQSKKARIHIGRIEADVWPDTPELLQGVPMSTQAEWNGQNWDKEAIQALKNNGYLEENDRGLAYIRDHFQKKTGIYW